jgi:hypothetical protein
VGGGYAGKPKDFVIEVLEPNSQQSTFVGGTFVAKGEDSTWWVRVRTTIKLDFSKVDPLSVVVVGNDVHCGGTNNEPVATQTHEDRKIEVDRDPIVLNLKDTDSAKRVARAVMHASLLCGGAKAVSPF